jgi:hypothetical protein
LTGAHSRQPTEPKNLSKNESNIAYNIHHGALLSEQQAQRHSTTARGLSMHTNGENNKKKWL